MLRTMGRLLVPALLSLCGCASTDQYLDRAISYNDQADRAYNSMLLLNVVRASQGMPTQFTDVSSIVGTSGATLGATFNGAPSPTGSASAGLASGVTFTVPVLNSKEFYQGLLDPISPETFHYFYQETRPLELVFNLLIDRMTISTADKGHCGASAYCTLVLTNDPDNKYNFELFQTVMEYLLENGFSTELVARKTPRSTLSMGKVQITVAASDDAAKADQPDSKKVVRYCFNSDPSTEAAFKASLPPEIRCGGLHASGTSRSDDPDATLRIPVTEMLASTLGGVAPAINQDGSPFEVSKDDADQVTKAVKALSGDTVDLRLRLRSTSGVIDYLGRILEAQAAGKYGAVLIRRTTVGRDKDGQAYAPCPARIDRVKLRDGRYEVGSKCVPFFVVAPGSGPFALAVGYGGTSYGIPADAGSAGASTRVMALLKQLFALNNNSKAAPTPAILTGTPLL